MIAGYTYLDPTRVGLVAAGVHGPIPNTAHNQANLWTTYDFDGGCKVGAGLNYIGRRDAGTDNAERAGQIITAMCHPMSRWTRWSAIRSTDNFALAAERL